jgi:hypothetical protein
VRVGLLTDLEMVNSVYRGLPVLQLVRRGHEVVLAWDHARRGPRLDALHGCDVVHIYRYCDAPVRRAAEQLRAAGVGIVWDNDDDLTTGPEGIGEPATKRGALRSQQIRSDMIRMMRLAHVVTTPSAVLAEQYHEWGAERVRVVENYLPAEYDPGPVEARRGGNGVTVGWTACGEHRYDLVHLGLRDVLARLLERHPSLRIVSVGLDLGLPRERYACHPKVQYQELAPLVVQFDVGIAPIADIPFNRARSNVKLKEYGAAGVPWLASPIGPYLGMGEKEGGRLVADERWFEELDRLVCDERARRKLVKRGAKWAAGERVAANMRTWEGALAEAAALT